MNDKTNVKRRNFLKSASLSAAGVYMAPLSKMSSSFAQPLEKSKIIISKDPLCFKNNKVDTQRVQNMVDGVVKKITGKTDTGKAYEALFPKPVTATTKILIKNNSSKPKTTRVPVTNAVKKGLMTMLNGTFPESNIRIVDKEGTANTNEKIKIGSNTYTIKDIWVDTDYFITVPSCRDITASIGGITMALKLQMSSVGGSSLSKMHPLTVNTESPWMSLISAHPVFKEKQVLVVLDALSSAAKGNSSIKATNTIIASKDMVAVDYQGMLLLKNDGLDSKKVDAVKKVCALAVKAPYNLGTDDPNNMEIINLDPTEIDVLEHTASPSIRVTVTHNQVQTHFMVSKPDLKHKELSISIHTAQGKQIWTQTSFTNPIVWNNRNQFGQRVPAGTYIYQIKMNTQTTKGVLMLQ